MKIKGNSKTTYLPTDPRIISRDFKKMWGGKIVISLGLRKLWSNQFFCSFPIEEPVRSRLTPIFVIRVQHVRFLCNCPSKKEHFLSVQTLSRRRILGRHRWSCSNMSCSDAKRQHRPAGISSKMKRGASHCWHHEELACHHQCKENH
jgi:hypothetical protein